MRAATRCGRPTNDVLKQGLFQAAVPLFAVRNLLRQVSPGRVQFCDDFHHCCYRRTWRTLFGKSFYVILHTSRAATREASWKRMSAQQTHTEKRKNGTGRIRTCNQGIMRSTSTFAASFEFVGWTIPSHYVSAVWSLHLLPEGSLARDWPAS